MAQTIKLKRSATTGNVPTTSQLALGELGINTTDGKLFLKKSVSGTESIVEVGSTGSFLPLSGGTLTGNLSLGDNVKAQFGNNDLQIYHDGSASYIKENGTGDLIIQGSNTMRLQGSSNQELANFSTGGAVTLFNNGSSRFATTSTGTLTTGTSVVSTSMMIGSTDSPSRDLEIKTTNPHIRLTDTDASGSYTEIFGGSGITTINADKGQNVSGSVLKLSVDATDGITINSNHNVSIPNGDLDVNGSVVADGLTVSGSITNTGNNYFADATSGYFFAGGGSFANGIYGYGTNNARIDTNSKIRINIASNGDISFYDSSGSSQNLFWDSSTSRLGLGVTNPANKLEISGGNIRIINQSTGRITFNNGSTEAYFGFNGAGSSTLDSGSQPLQIQAQGSNHIQFDTNSAERLKINADGSSVFSGSVSAPTIKMDALLPIDDDNTDIGSGSLQFANAYIGDTAYLGKVMVGSTTAPTSALEISGGNNLASQIRLINTAPSTDNVWTIHPQYNDQTLRFKGNGTTDVLTLADTGAATFSGSVSSTGLDVNGYTYIRKTADNNARLHIIGGRDYMFTSLSNGTLGIYDNTASSYRLTIDASGNTNIPNGSLMVGSTTAPTGNFNSYISATRQITHNGNGGDLSVISDNNSNPVFYVKGTGNADLVNVFDNTTEVFKIADGGAATFSGSVTSTTGFTTGANTRVQSSSGMLFVTGAAATVFEVGAGSEKMRLLSTGLGIGTQVPSSALTVSGSIPNAPTGNGVHLGFASNYAQIQLNGSSGGIIDFSTSGVDSIGRILYDQASDYMRFDTNYAERMRIDSSGNVGIGLDNPSYPLEVAGNVKFNNASFGAFISPHGDDTYINMLGSGRIQFRTNGSERFRINADGSCRWTPDGTNHDMTLTADGNLLVGKTSANFTVAGHEIKPNSFAGFTRDGGCPVIINRLTNSGDLTEFYQGLSSVGKIGVMHTNNMYFTGLSGHGGLQFGTANVTPLIAGSESNGGVDLGASNLRFKDLYLSRRVNFGGVAGNHFAGYDGVTDCLQLAAKTFVRFQTGTNYDEAARIDASQNLLVGQTSAYTGAGVTISPLGVVQAERNNISGVFNRTSTDGEIIQFRKDGTTVGSIGTSGGDVLIYSTATDHKGLRFGEGYVFPTDNTGATSDGDTDLGIASAARFRDLHLSGTVNASYINSGSDTNTFINFAGSDIIRFGNGGSESARLTSGGDLLVGKTSTDFNTAGFRVTNYGGIQPVVAGGTTANFNRLNSDGEIVDFRRDGTTKGNISVSAYGMGLGGGTRSSDFFIKTDGTASFASGIDVGIGTGSPATAISAWSSSANGLSIEDASYPVLALKKTGSNPAWVTMIDNDLSLYSSSGGNIRFGAGSELARLTSGGEFLIGASSAGDAGITLDGSPSGNSVPSMELVRDFSGTATMIRFTNISGSPYVGSISSTTSATAYNTSSDERLKDNIVDAPIASEDIDAIQVRSFDWKADGEHQKYGMVAQELLEVAPDAVTQGETPDDMMGVDYSKLVPMLIKEIQSLRQRVAQLEE